MVLFLPWHAHWCIITITSPVIVAVTHPEVTKGMTEIWWFFCSTDVNLEIGMSFNNSLITSWWSAISSPIHERVLTRMTLFSYVVDHILTMLPIGFPFIVISLLKAACFLLEAYLLLSGVDMSLWMFPGIAALADVEFTKSADYASISSLIASNYYFSR